MRHGEAGVVAAGAAAFAVMLGGRAAKTPAGAPLVLPARPLAEAVAGEWAHAPCPLSMPLTCLAATAIDRVGPRRPAVLAGLRACAAADLLCYRAQRPVELVRRQQSRWQPLLAWAAERGATLVVTAGIVPVAQPEAALAALERAFAGLDDFALTAAQAVAAATGSALIALALAVGRLDGEEAFAAAALDDLYGLEIWGEDAEAHRRLAALRDDIVNAGRFLALTGGGPARLAGRAGGG